MEWTKTLDSVLKLISTPSFRDTDLSAPDKI